MSPIKTNNGFEALFDESSNKLEDSLVGFMTRQIQRPSLPQEAACFQDVQLRPLRMPNPIILPHHNHNHNASRVLDNIDVDLLSTSLDKPNTSTDGWAFVSFLSSDLEPTPIKPDLLLRQEEPKTNHHHDGKNGNCSAASLKCASTTRNTQRSDSIQKGDTHVSTNKQQSEISTTSNNNTKDPSYYSNKPSCTKDAHAIKKKRKSKHPVFRPYQKHQFQEQYEALLRFKEEHGHCLVPHMYKADPALSRWVKRQRYQFKLKIANNNESTMTQERMEMLEDIGFVWDSHKFAWQDRLKELEEYKEGHGDCNVPSTYLPNPALATWVKCQRRLYRRLRKGEACNITLERIAILDALGFDWRRRS